MAGDIEAVGNLPVCQSRRDELADAEFGGGEARPVGRDDARLRRLTSELFVTQPVAQPRDVNSSSHLDLELKTLPELSAGFVRICLREEHGIVLGRQGSSSRLAIAWTRSRKRLTPWMPAVCQGLACSRGPMNIS